jgi:hypothetical protein
MNISGSYVTIFTQLNAVSCLSRGLNRFETEMFRQMHNLSRATDVSCKTETLPLKLTDINSLELEPCDHAL